MEESIHDKWCRHAKRDNVLGYLVFQSGIDFIAEKLESILVNQMSKGPAQSLMDDISHVSNDEGMPEAILSIITKGSDSGTTLLYTLIFSRWHKLTKLDGLVSKLLDDQLQSDDRRRSIGCTAFTRKENLSPCDSLDPFNGWDTDVNTQPLKSFEACRTRSLSCEVYVDISSQRKMDVTTKQTSSVLKESNNTKSNTLQKKFSLSYFDPFRNESTSSQKENQKQVPPTLELGNLTCDDWSEYRSVESNMKMASGKSDLMWFSPKRKNSKGSSTSFKQRRGSAPPSPILPLETHGYSNMRA